ncbi:unnamed protein product [Paramecium octaurelia]|uniref:Uncharacterized protein n=1 Tax=Paramecium octaurelia TaxID=43137 RepID=A0A8S1VW15_PAROT|nr:unnamed protein product [Paramecium octaurelia]
MKGNTIAINSEIAQKNRAILYYYSVLSTVISKTHYYQSQSIFHKEEGIKSTDQSKVTFEKIFRQICRRQI